MVLFSKQAVQLLSLCLSTCLLLTPASAQSNNPSVFVKPPQSGDNDDFSQNPTWYLNTTMEILWNTTSQAFYMALYQQQNDGGIPGQDVYQYSGIGDDVNQTSWLVDIGHFSLATSKVFFFWVFPGDGVPEFTSHYFNIESLSAASSTSSTSSTTSTSSSAITSSPTTSSTATSSSTILSTTSSVTASPAATSTAPPVKETNTTSLGVGIGVGIGAALLIGGLIALVYFKKRHTKRKAQTASNHFAPDNSNSDPYAAGLDMTTTGLKVHHRQGGTGPQDVRSSIAELPPNPYHNATTIAELPNHRRPAAELPER